MSFPITKEEILAISKPEDLFPGDKDQAHDLYRQLARRWHPDLAEGDIEAFQHIKVLYDQTVGALDKGTWGGKSTFKFKTRTGESWELQYLASRPFELGQFYVADTHISYLVEKEHLAFLKNAEAFTGIFSYANDKMKTEMAKYLPKDVKVFQLDDGRALMRVPKTEDLVCLRDVLDYLGGKMDPKHAAWIGSGMHNIACYLRWAGLVHMNFSPESVFISPQLHGVALMGGWWYATKEGKPINALPTRSHDFLPWEVRTSKAASYLVDLELIRATVRELLGDIAGNRLKDPPDLVGWLKTPATGEPIDVYKDWHQVLEKTFGKRRFTEMKLDHKELYNKQ